MPKTIRIESELTEMQKKNLEKFITDKITKAKNLLTRDQDTKLKNLTKKLPIAVKTIIKKYKENNKKIKEAQKESKKLDGNLQKLGFRFQYFCSKPDNYTINVKRYLQKTKESNQVAKLENEFYNKRETLEKILKDKTFEIWLGKGTNAETFMKNLDKEISNITK